MKIFQQNFQKKLSWEKLYRQYSNKLEQRERERVSICPISIGKWCNNSLVWDFWWHRGGNQTTKNYYLYHPVLKCILSIHSGLWILTASNVQFKIMHVLMFTLILLGMSNFNDSEWYYHTKIYLSTYYLVNIIMSWPITTMSSLSCKLHTIPTSSKKSWYLRLRSSWQIVP